MGYHERQSKKQEFLDLAQELLSEYRPEELVKFLVEELNFRFPPDFISLYVNIEDNLYEVGERVTLDEYQSSDKANIYVANQRGIYRQKNGRFDFFVAVRHDFLEGV